MLWAHAMPELAVTVCQNCGSRRFRADRALAGRLVCQTCGMAAGSRPTRRAGNSRVRTRRTNRWGWFLLLLIAVVALVMVMA